MSTAYKALFCMVITGGTCLCFECYMYIYMHAHVQCTSSKHCLLASLRVGPNHFYYVLLELQQH